MGCGAKSGDIPQIGYLECVFGNFFKVFLGLAGIALFVTLLIGGFKFITSGGDPKNLASAKATLTYAIFGMILVAGSYLILVFIETITGANVTNFSIYTN